MTYHATKKSFRATKRVITYAYITDGEFDYRVYPNGRVDMYMSESETYETMCPSDEGFDEIRTVGLKVLTSECD